MKTKTKSKALESVTQADWYKDAIIYELSVRAFQDSNGDGVGDFPGLISRLDYLKELGINTIWLMPFFPSPLRDDGYDVADFTDVHPDYGTLQDFRTFLREAHERGLRVVIELVLAHTSDQHPWFEKARTSPAGSPARDFYLWSQTGRELQDARVIFSNTERSNWAWDREAQAYYFHRFFSHQPALNYDNPRVREAMIVVIDFWLKLGVDGLRLDAVAHLFQREGTSGENLPEVHAFLKELRAHVDERFPGRALMADVNLWPEETATYFGKGDECHMAFNFPLMPRLFLALQMEDQFPIMDILEQTPAAPEGCQWCLFLRNHDDLTLVMVTDEERDLMFRSFGQDPRMRLNLGIRRRLAPLLGFSRRRLELMNALIFSLPGSPCIYYGDEIAMGDNVFLGDREGVRTPMQWSADRNAGFSTASTQQLYAPVVTDPQASFETVNVEAQLANSHSFIRWMMRLIALRRRYACFGRGETSFLPLDNNRLLAFIRSCGEEHVLVVANLSRFTQGVELDLQRFAGSTPVDVFGGQELREIGEDGDYYLTLGPHTFYWFELRPARKEGEGRTGGGELATLSVGTKWQELFGERRESLLQALETWMPQRRWFGGKARRVKEIILNDVLPLPKTLFDAVITLVRVVYTEGPPENYVLAFSFAQAKLAKQIEGDMPHAAIARLTIEKSGEEGLLFDASANVDFCASVLAMIEGKKRVKGTNGELQAGQSKAFRALRGEGALTAKASKAEQSNTSIIYGDRLIMKIFRRPDEGVNPDLEIARFLTDQGRFHSTAAVAGFIEYERPRAESMTVAMLQQFAPNRGDAWKFTLEELDATIARIVKKDLLKSKITVPTAPLLELSRQEAPEELVQVAGRFLELIALLGTRTGEMHAALADSIGNPDFQPEPLGGLTQRSLSQSFRNHTNAALQLLKRKLGGMPAGAREVGQWVLDHAEEIRGIFASLSTFRATSFRTRVHGDYHLGQVLFTGEDFIIIDFEGEPARSIGERRLKRSPIVDVAGMLRSFQYAAYTGLRTAQEKSLVKGAEVKRLEGWCRLWQRWTCAAYLRAYLAVPAPVRFLPDNEEELRLLLSIFQMNKALYEIMYELNNRPDWVAIPLSAVKELVEEGTK